MSSYSYSSTNNYYNTGAGEDSPKQQYLNQRKKININTWQSVGQWSDQQQQEQQTKLWCPVCKVKLIPQDNGRVMFCHECGQKTPTTQIKHEGIIAARYGRPAANTGPIVLSQGADQQKKQKKKNIDSINSDLDPEDLKFLRECGYNI